MRAYVKDVMSKGVLKLSKGQTIKEVNQLFLDRVIDGAPVVDEAGKVIGVFTKTHLMRAMGRSLDTPIDLLMNKNIISIGETMPIEEAMNIPVGRLPVVDKDGKMVGWLTRTDLARAFQDVYKRTVENLSSIIDTMINGIIVIDNDGKIKIFSKAAERLWNVEAEEIIGLPINEVFPAIDMESVLQTGEPVSHMIQVDEEIFEIDIRPIFANKNITGVVAEFYQPTK
jgi:PAS domain S-box-containing protein